MVGGRGKRYRMGRWGIRGLETRVGPDCTVEVYMSEESEEGVAVLVGAASRVRALNLDRGSREHLRWTHLEQAQHCTDLPRQVTFPAHTEQGKMGPGLE